MTQRRWQPPVSLLPEWIKVSPGVKEAFPFIASNPLISRGNLSLLMGRSKPYFYPLVDDLVHAGLVATVRLGCLTQKADRLFVTPYGRQFLTASDRSWQDDGGRALLLARFPVTEALPMAASRVTGRGRLLSFNWYQRFAWDAAARFENGFVLFFWSGLLQRERHIRNVFLNLGPDLLEVAAPGPNPWPGLLCFVVHDQWQEVLVRRVAKGFGFENQIMFYLQSGELLSPADSPVESRGGIEVPEIDARLGNWSWEARVASSPWSGELPHHFYRQLTLTAEWPRANIDFARTAVGEKPESRNVQKSRKVMRKGNKPFLDARRDRGVYRDTITTRSFHLLAANDRVASNRIPAALQGPAGTGNSPVHDDGVMALMREFLSAGLVAANGWRSWERWSGGGIEPDGMVRLTRSPFGPGWHYVEYERAARYPARAGRKLGSYLSDRRQDNYPVLFVLWNDTAETAFQTIGQENGGRSYPARLLTTTLERLARCGALGNGCWSWYGQPVSIG